MAEPEAESQLEDGKRKKETKRPYKRKHEQKKLAEIQNKYDFYVDTCSVSTCFILTLNIFFTN